MLDPLEAGQVATAFGVATEQVRRDHLVSHLLAGLAEVPECTDRLVFFGGTALARTHLRQGRLSEDIDLLARGDRTDVARDIEKTLGRSVRREFGALQWVPGLTRVRSVQPALARTADGLGVRVQLLRAEDFPDWPTEIVEIDQRYLDVRATRLRVPTLAAFAAAKTVAWADRHAARDLFDLCALAGRGAITSEAARLYEQHGPTGHAPPARFFESPPTEQQWRTELEALTRLEITASEALAVVRDAWSQAVDRRRP